MNITLYTTHCVRERMLQNGDKRKRQLSEIRILWVVTNATTTITFTCTIVEYIVVVVAASDLFSCRSMFLNRILSVYVKQEKKQYELISMRFE